MTGLRQNARTQVTSIPARKRRTPAAPAWQDPSAQRREPLREEPPPTEVGMEVLVHQPVVPSSMTRCNDGGPGANKVARPIMRQAADGHPTWRPQTLQTVDVLSEGFDPGT